MSPPRTVQGARFACQGSGFCCRFHQLGPVGPAEVQVLRDAAPETWWPPAAQGWLHTALTPTGPVHQLAKVDGHCVFLDEQQRCAVHARLGPQAKPGFCRLFPYQVVEDARGLSVSLRASCGGLHAALRDGEPVEDQVDEVLALARDGGVVVRWTPPQVAVAPGWQETPASWLDHEAALLAALPTVDLQPEALVAWVRDTLAARAGVSLPVPEPGRAALATRAVLMALDLTLQHVRDSETPPSQAEADFVATMHDRIRAAATAVEAGHRAPLDADARTYVRDLLAQALLGKEVHRLGSLSSGMGRFLTAVVVAGHAAPEPGPEAFAQVHSRVVRFTQNRSVRAILDRARPALDDLFLHAMPEAR